MARMNGKRRRAARQRAAATQFACALNPTTQPNEGFSRSSTGLAKQRLAAQVVPAVARSYTPKEPLWEGRGKRGHVSRGKLVPIKPSAEHDSRPLTASEQRAPGVKITVPNTQIERLRRTFNSGRPVKEYDEGQPKFVTPPHRD